jgi:hypothetical protein
MNGIMAMNDSKVQAELNRQYDKGHHVDFISPDSDRKPTEYESKY